MERTSLTNDLKKIYKSLSKMTSLVLQNINDSIVALEDQDITLAKIVSDNDEAINAMEVKIDRDCIIFVAKNQPVAKDLRLIQSIYKISTDLERIGDIAQDIANLQLLITYPINDKMLEKVINMAVKVKQMVSDSINSFINDKVNLAYNVLEKDDEVDATFYQLREDLITFIEKNDNINVRDYIYYISIIKYLEKMGDHASNIAKWIIYNVIGEFR